MYIARVVGTVVSTHKNDRLDGKKLLLVRRLDLNDAEDGSVETIALDVVDAGVGDRVLVVQEGSSARKIFDDEKIPVQAVIVGVVDSVTLNRGNEHE
ncbi:MAG: EutN/CcmL family microcompartment protein [Gemmatimonadales bacterium]